MRSPGEVIHLTEGTVTKRRGTSESRRCRQLNKQE